VVSTGDLITIDDPVTLVLLGTLLVLGVTPVIVLALRRVTQLPFQVASLRWVYWGWALLLAASSVWNLARDVRYSAEEAGADNFVRLGFLALGILVILFVGAKYRFAFLPELLFGALGIFFVFSLWGMVSTLWSIAPVVSLYKSVEYGAMLVLFALTVSLIRYGVREPHKRLLALKGIFDWNWFLVFLLLVSVYLSLLIWPEVGIVPNKSMLGFSVQGALPAISANGVGQLAAIMAIVALVRVLLKPGSRLVYVPLFAFSLITIVLAQSRSPILGFVLALVVVLIVSRRFGFLAIVASLAGVVSLIYGQTIYEFLRRGQSNQELMTLTGRTRFWEASLDAVRESPLTGYGAYAGGRYVVHEPVASGDGPTTVHSLWVEVLVDTGIVGLLLVLVGLSATWLWMFKLRVYAAGNPISQLLWLEGLGVLTVLSVRSVFSVPLVWSPNVLTFGLLLVFIAVMRREIAQRSYPGIVLAQPLPATRRRRSGIYG
jgi:O-antigen ligase